VDQIVNLAFKDKDRVGHIDMESLEMSIRTSMHGIGSMVLSKFINRDGGDYRGRTISCDKGHTYEFVEYRDVEDVIRAVQRLRPQSGYDKEVCAREVGYFEKNKERMRYAEFRRRGLFVGSGVVEAG